MTTTNSVELESRFGQPAEAELLAVPGPEVRMDVEKNIFYIFRELTAPGYKRQTVLYKNPENRLVCVAYEIDFSASKARWKKVDLDVLDVNAVCSAQGDPEFLAAIARNPVQEAAEATLKKAENDAAWAKQNIGKPIKEAKTSMARSILRKMDPEYRESAESDVDEEISKMTDIENTFKISPLRKILQGAV